MNTTAGSNEWADFTQGIDYEFHLDEKGYDSGLIPTITISRTSNPGNRYPLLRSSCTIMLMAS